MRVWTVHTRPEGAGGEPVRLVREGFSWGAFLLGPLWLLAQRLWLATLGWLALLAGAALLPGPVRGPAIFGLVLLTGAHARDLLRRRLAKLGYRETGVVAAPNQDSATARLLAERPALAAPMARAALA